MLEEELLFTTKNLAETAPSDIATWLWEDVPPKRLRAIWIPESMFVSDADAAWSFGPSMVASSWKMHHKDLLISTEENIGCHLLLRLGHSSLSSLYICHRVVTPHPPTNHCSKREQHVSHAERCSGAWNSVRVLTARS